MLSVDPNPPSIHRVQEVMKLREQKVEITSSLDLLTKTKFGQFMTDEQKLIFDIETTATEQKKQEKEVEGPDIPSAREIAAISVGVDLTKSITKEEAEKVTEKMQELRKAGATQFQVFMGKPGAKEVIEAQTAVDALTTVGALFSKDFVGRILGVLPKGSIQEALLKMGLGPENPNAGPFYASISKWRAIVINTLAGAAIGPVEAELYLASLPNIDEHADLFLSKYNLWQLDGKRLAKRLDQMVKTGKSDIPALTKKDLIKAGILIEDDAVIIIDKETGERFLSPAGLVPKGFRKGQ